MNHMKVSRIERMNVKKIFQKQVVKIILSRLADRFLSIDWVPMSFLPWKALKLKNMPFLP